MSCGVAKRDGLLGVDVGLLFVPRYIGRVGTKEEAAAKVARRVDPQAVTRWERID